MNEPVSEHAAGNPDTADTVDTVDTADTELITRLRTMAAQADPPPELVLEAGRAAFLMRRIDAELAELVLDSAVDAGPVSVRGASGLEDDTVRMLSFETDTVAIEVQVTEADGQRSLLGLVSGASGPVEVETALGRSTVALDALGRFSVAEVPPGTVRLHLVADSGTPVTTSWVSL
jgi:hypothetical protein